DYNGSDSIAFKANDGSTDSNTATMNLMVNAVNDAPEAFDEPASTNEDTPTDITLEATDADGDPLSYIIVSGPSHGSLSGPGANRTYTPEANFHGQDSLLYKASDGQVESHVATYILAVASVNDAPVAAHGSATTQEDTALTGKVVATDADDDQLSFEVVSGPS